MVAGLKRSSEAAIGEPIHDQDLPELSVKPTTDSSSPAAHQAHTQVTPQQVRIPQQSLVQYISTILDCNGSLAERLDLHRSLTKSNPPPTLWT